MSSSPSPNPDPAPTAPTDPGSDASDAVLLGESAPAFLEDLSQEVASALDPILEVADQLQKHPSDAPMLAPRLQERVERLQEPLEAMVRQMRLANESAALAPETIDAANLAETVCDQFEQSAEEKRPVPLEAPDSPIETTTDAETLRRALTLLVGRAVAGMQEGTPTVRLDATDEEVRFHVRVPDLKIPDAAERSLFDPFQQRGPEHGKRSNGLGLALPLARALAQHLGGTVEADSPSGAGSVITLHVSRTLPSRETCPDPSEGANKPPRVLIVEDNDVTQRLLRRMLEDNYRVDAVAGAEAGIQKARENTYDAFILDVNLKGRRTGIEVLHAVQKMEPHKSAPAVACTAYALDDHKNNFLRVGFDGVVSKPVTKREILDVLERSFEDSTSPEIGPPVASLSGIELPSLPTTLVTIAGLPSSNPGEGDIETLTQALKKDQVVSQWVLHHLNSAYYGMREPIGSVERAVRYLGFRPVCNLVLTRIIGTSFSGADVPGAEQVQRWVMKTSTLAAFIARELAKRFDLDDPALAYTGGMFAQIGRLVLLEAEGEAYVDLWFEERDWFEEKDRTDSFLGPPPQGQEILHFEEDYVQNSLAVGQTCGLSDEVLSILHGHPRPTMVREQFQPLVPIVALALEAAERVGDLGDETPDGDLEALSAVLHDRGVVHHLTRQRSISTPELVSEVVEVTEDAKEFVGQALD